jgi:hypothetical protein
LLIANSPLNNKDFNNLKLDTNFVQDFSTNNQNNSDSLGTVLEFKQPTEWQER